MILIMIGAVFIFLGIAIWGAALWNHNGGSFANIAPGVLMMTVGGIIANAGYYKNKRGTIR